MHASASAYCGCIGWRTTRLGASHMPKSSMQNACALATCLAAPCICSASKQASIHACMHAKTQAFMRAPCPAGQQPTSLSPPLISPCCSHPHHVALWQHYDADRRRHGSRSLVGANLVIAGPHMRSGWIASAGGGREEGYMCMRTSSNRRAAHRAGKRSPSGKAAVSAPAASPKVRPWRSVPSTTASKR
eukprot:24722-Chlamydomonas_euryale.AAC.1